MNERDERRYSILERTVTVEDALGAEQLAQIEALLGKTAARPQAVAPGFMFDLTELEDADSVLRYLREQRLAHTLAEERRWEPAT
jgi:hypothetical protein